LASSSAGNSVFVGTEKTRILIDAGLSRKQTLLRLASIGEDPSKLDAVFITHEHSDHILGLPAIARGLKIPVFLTKRTAPLIDWNGTVPQVEEFQAGAAIELGDMSIQSFTIPHDAVDPVGYSVRAGGLKFSVATDLGYMPDSVKWHIDGSHILLLESNHDLDMLKAGPYPWAVKQRVLSRKGHLSNDLACDYIRSNLTSSVQTLILGHLSEHNNHPSIAEISAVQALQERSASPRLIVATPRVQTDLFHL
jgi:phosphoribosyl 1,2-cyclic phosphodiesterase